MNKDKHEGRYYTLPRAFGRIREDRIYDVPLSEIAEDLQKRRRYDEVRIAKLANSIRENGLCEPILLLSNREKPKADLKDGIIRYIPARIKEFFRTVSRRKKYRFSLISGAYRLRAYRLLGSDTIPARFLCEQYAFLPDSVIRSERSERAERGERAEERGNPELSSYILKNRAFLARKNRLAASLCTHEFTENLHYFDEAAHLSALCSIFGCRINHLAAVLTLDKKETENKVALLMLSGELRDRLTDARLPEPYAQLLLRLPNDAARKDALDRITEESMSLPDAERLITQMCTENCNSYTQTRQFYCKDPRILVNSVVKAAKSIQNSGLSVAYEVTETEDGASVTVNVKKPTGKELVHVSRET